MVVPEILAAQSIQKESSKKSGKGGVMDYDFIFFISPPKFALARNP